MKKYIILKSLILGLLLSCQTKKEHPEYVVISGQLKNTLSKKIRINKGRVKKAIPIHDDGTFNDTLSVKEGVYALMLFKDHKLSQIYIENGADLQLSADISDYDNTLKFTEDFSSFNNYLHGKYLVDKSDIGLNKTMYRYQKGNFDSMVRKYKGTVLKLLQSYPDITENLIEQETVALNKKIEKFTSKYEKQNSQFQNLAKNMPSPTFNNYLNYYGGTTSLSDFKDKYVFIDVWATWCVPCKAQIPFLKEFEKKYHGKNIEFVSISVDFNKDLDKWKASVANLELNGTQLFAPKSFESDFIKGYNIKAIPRFILIGPEGKIVDFDAPKPSKKEELMALFNSLNI